MAGQIDIFDEIIVDNFAGGGGASTGIELATGRVVDIAINHDPDAILMHKTNHPYTEHIRASVWDVDPVDVCRGRPVGLAWFSPDCKHFSKAKGAALVDRNIRGLAWIVLRWAGTVRPRVIILENVEEFQSWGPVRKGKPVKKLAGRTFLKWKRQLSDLGYHIEHRELVAADYGAPTIRKRFVLIARCDGRPIVWPKRTHAPAGHWTVRDGKCKPWRSAAEILDLSLPMYSIFETKAEIKEKFGVNTVRPLKPNTMRRIARGLDKFVIKTASPFIMCNNANNVPHGLDEPMPTITTGNRNFLVAPTLIQYHSEQHEREARGQNVNEPLRTIDAANRYGLTVAFMQKYFSGVDGSDLRKPVPTITAVDHNSLTAVHIAKFKGKNKGQGVREPLQTITATVGQFALIETTIQRYAEQRELKYWPRVREMLNQYCGYTLADDEILLFGIAESWYFIADIGLRMLTPRELYAAMGFPPDYIIDRDYMGHEYGKTKQVARCGNAVCPPMAEAVVRANYAAAPVTIITMAQLQKAVAM